MISKGSSGRDIDLRELVDRAPLGPFQLRVIIICFLTAVTDGLDNQAVGFAAPAIAADLGLPLSSFGIIFSAGLIGGLVGAMTMGIVADKIGRKMSLLICTAIFGLFTFGTAYATSVGELVVLRLLAGFGLGGAMPCFLTMVAEYAPKARRAFIMAVLWVGYPTGGMIGGFIGSLIIDDYGWTSIFLLGGFMAVAIGLMQLLFLPESVQFLALKARDFGRVSRIAKRLAPAEDLEAARYHIVESKAPAKIPVVDLFLEGRAGSTLLLWGIMFSTFMITSFFVLWSPGLLKQAGLSIETAAMMIALLNMANLPSTAFSGFLIDKVGPFKLLFCGYLLLAIAIFALALSLGATLLIASLMAAIGFLQGPGVAGCIFLATRMYPAHIRSTGSGWGTGIGRSGQVFGSLAIGALVAHGTAPSTVFMLLCLPALFAAMGIFILARRLADDSM